MKTNKLLYIQKRLFFGMAMLFLVYSQAQASSLSCSKLFMAELKFDSLWEKPTIELGIDIHINLLWHPSALQNQVNEISHALISKHFERSHIEVKRNKLILTDIHLSLAGEPRLVEDFILWLYQKDYLNRADYISLLNYVHTQDEQFKRRNGLNISRPAVQKIQTYKQLYPQLPVDVVLQLTPEKPLRALLLAFLDHFSSLSIYKSKNDIHIHGDLAEVVNFMFQAYQTELLHPRDLNYNIFWLVREFEGLYPVERDPNTTIRVIR